MEDTKFAQSLETAKAEKYKDAVVLLCRIRDAHYEFESYGNEHVLPNEFWDSVDGILDFFCLLPLKKYQKSDLVNQSDGFCVSKAKDKG